jgi:hypothetical protein
MRLSAFPTFANDTTMDAADLDVVFLKDSAHVDDATSLYNVLYAIEDENLDAAAVLGEDLFQFLPFPGAGGHNHDGTDSSFLASGAVDTKQIDRNEASLIFTGKERVLMNCGQQNNFTVNTGVGAASFYGVVPIYLFLGGAGTGADYLVNHPGMITTQISVVIASITRAPGGTARAQPFVEIDFVGGLYYRDFDIYVVSTVAMVASADLDFHAYSMRA